MSPERAPSTPSAPAGYALVPIILPPLAVSEIKDMIEAEYDIYDAKARPLWASLLSIVAGMPVEEQEAHFVAERGRAPAPLSPPSAPVVDGPVGVEDLTIRELQTRLPWTIRYSRDFRASPAAHKDFAHALHHVSKAAGKLHALADDMDHDREVADDPALRNSYGKYVADLVVCALRIANTFPGGVLDLQQATQARIEDKNGVALTPAAAPKGKVAEVARLQAVIERDRTVFCSLIVRCKNVLAGRKHLGDEHARAAAGYAHDEPGFIREFGEAWTEIMNELERMHRVFQDFTDSPRGGDAVRAAQAEAERILTTTPAASEDGLPDKHEVRRLHDCERAWRAVCDLLNELVPDWFDNDMMGREAALAAIRRLAASGQGVEEKWLTMDSCPVNQRVLLWNQDTEEMSIGHKPEDAPSVEAVIIAATAAWADAWRPLPSEPDSETHDGPPTLSVVAAAPTQEKARQ